MNREEIDYWLRLFSNNNQCFMSKDGKIITLFKVFQELKELQYLLKIKNDYINELDQKNQELKDNWNKLKDYFTNITNYSPIDDNPLCEILIMTYEDINNKMQELEKSDSND